MLVLPSFEDLKAKLIQYKVSLAQDLAQENMHQVMLAGVSSIVQPPGQGRVYANYAGRGLFPKVSYVISMVTLRLIVSSILRIKIKITG